jgi:hypothetical protein
MAEQCWGVGVDVYHLQVDGQELIVFSDAYSIDIEGPAALVCRVGDEYTRMM